MMLLLCEKFVIKMIGVNFEKYGIYWKLSRLKLLYFKLYKVKIFKSKLFKRNKVDNIFL